MAENKPAEIPRTTLPRYAREAAELALQLATLTTEEPADRRDQPPALPAVPRRRGPPRAAGLHGRRIQAYRPGAIHPRGFRIRTAAPQHHVVPLRAAPAAGRNPPLPAGRGRRIAGARRPNDVRVLAGTADGGLPRKNPCRRRHPGQPRQQRDEAPVRLETHPPRSAYHHARIPHP